MTHHPIITGCLLAAAVALCLLCCLGVVIMRDAFQRLQFTAPVVSIAMLLIIVAVWIEDAQWQSRIKAILIGLVLFFTNATLSHATARAIRIRRQGKFPPTPDEHIPIVNSPRLAGDVGGGSEHSRGGGT